MFQKLIATKDDVSLLVLRLTVGTVMFAHGAQKMLGWFGELGPADTIAKWTKWFGFHPAVTWLFIIAEFTAPILLVAGFLSRVMAAVITAIMIGAMYFVTFKWGFYMNWYTDPNRGEGYELHLLVMAICIAIMIKGSGKYSVDRWLQKNGELS